MIILIIPLIIIILGFIIFFSMVTYIDYTEHKKNAKNDKDSSYYGTYDDFVTEFSAIPIDKWSISKITSNIIYVEEDHRVSACDQATVVFFDKFKFDNANMIIDNFRDFILVKFFLARFIKAFKYNAVLKERENKRYWKDHV